jgi:hypothetical protein
MMKVIPETRRAVYFWLDRVDHTLGFCVVIFCIIYLLTVSYVPNVATASGFAILDCIFDFF